MFVVFDFNNLAIACCATLDRAEAVVTANPGIAYNTTFYPELDDVEWISANIDNPWDGEWAMSNIPF